MTVEKEYKEYLSKMKKHLFNDAPIEEIMKEVHQSHRKRRFVAMYLAQDKETFDYYYDKRKELGLENVFSQLISALLHETNKNRIKSYFLKTLGVKRDMIDFPCFEYEMNEIKKDLNSFLLYLRKQKMKNMKKEADQ